MSEYFERLDKDLERQPMPPEYDKYISHIFCNDCEKKTQAKYHFFYHKCGHCGSFNTTVLKTENTEETARGESSNEQQPLEQAMQRSGMNHDRNTMAGPSSSRTNNPDSNEG
ncbi:hypothetical protein RMCBS344292_00805 [Rhizopus microsporus]|nr:hypothetical protein RMCBS344292_00805 [Rhizopus microsporus]